MLDQGSGGEASPCGVREQFLADTLASKLKGSNATIINRCRDKLYSSAGHKCFSCDC